MASTARKVMMATPAFMGRSNADRKAYRAANKAAAEKFYEVLARGATKAEVDAAHAEWQYVGSADWWVARGQTARS